MEHRLVTGYLTPGKTIPSISRYPFSQVLGILGNKIRHGPYPEWNWQERSDDSQSQAVTTDQQKDAGTMVTRKGKSWWQTGTGSGCRMRRDGLVKMEESRCLKRRPSEAQAPNALSQGNEMEQPSFKPPTGTASVSTRLRGTRSSVMDKASPQSPT